MKIILTEGQVKRLNDRIISEQIDTDDEERELMAQWYGDDEEDEYEEMDYNYAPEYDIDSEDSYDLSHGKDIESRMNRSLRLGNAGSTGGGTKTYTIDGKDHTLTPVEYRQMLKGMGRITPEKAGYMGINIDKSGVMRKGSDEVRTKTKALEKRIRNISDDIERFQSEFDRLTNMGRKDENLGWKLKYLRSSLGYYMDELDELTGNVNGEE